MARLHTIAMSLFMFASYTIQPVPPETPWTNSTMDSIVSWSSPNITEDGESSTNITEDDGSSTNITKDDGSSTNITEDDWSSTNITKNDGSPPNSSFKTVGENKTDTTNGVNVLTWVVREVITSVIAVLGLVGNCIAVCVLASPRMKSPNSVILIFLAFFDSLILLRHILFGTVKTILSEYLSPVRLNEIYSIPVNVIFRPFEHIGYFGSIYTTVLLTFERFFVVLFPLRAISVCTIKHAKICGFIILFLSAVYNIPKFLFGTIHIEEDQITHLTKFVFVKLTLPRGVDFFFHNIYREYLEKIFLLALPALTLVILNTCILYKLWQKSRQFKAEGSAVFGRRANIADKITAMTLAIIFTFCVTLVVLQFDRNLCLVPIEKTVQLPERCHGLHLIANLMLTFNSAINFVYYCLFGVKFRKVLLSCCARPVQRQGSTSLSTTTANEVSMVSYK